MRISLIFNDGPIIEGSEKSTKIKQPKKKIIYTFLFDIQLKTILFSLLVDV